MEATWAASQVCKLTGMVCAGCVAAGIVIVLGEFILMAGIVFIFVASFMFALLTVLVVGFVVVDALSVVQVVQSVWQLALGMWIVLVFMLFVFAIVLVGALLGMVGVLAGVVAILVVFVRVMFECINVANPFFLTALL